MYFLSIAMLTKESVKKIHILCIVSYLLSPYYCLNTGWSKETVDCNSLLTDPKLSKSVITQWFLESLYREVLVFWCFKSVRYVEFCLFKHFQYRAFAAPYKAWKLQNSLTHIQTPWQCEINNKRCVLIGLIIIEFSPNHFRVAPVGQSVFLGKFPMVPPLMWGAKASEPFESETLMVALLGLPFKIVCNSGVATSC